MSQRIEMGCRVSLRYRLLRNDGYLVDESGDEPFDLTVGDGALHPNLERAIEGLVAGERVRLLLGPEEAFGLSDPANIYRVPRSDFPADQPLAPGYIFEFAAPNGMELLGQVVELVEDEVVVDFNHPLAGQPAVFEVEVLTVSAP